MIPLIDKLHAATITGAGGLAYIKDLYALRTVIRKAQCFTIDAESSGLISDFSIAIAQNIEDVRGLAIPPYPVTWFDIDNFARLKHMRENGIRLTQQADFDPVLRVGWLIERHQSQHTAYRATYVTDVDQGIIVGPLAFGWDIEGNDCPWPYNTGSATGDLKMEMGMLFGVRSMPIIKGAWFVDPPGAKFEGQPKSMIRQAAPLMQELRGELRSIFGLLLALGASPPKEGKPYVSGEVRTISGKHLLPREHRVLTISLRRKETAPEAVRRAVAAHRKRLHDVRGHLRTYRNEDGSVKRIVPISAHKRGDKKLGVITKTYEIKR